MFAKQAAIEGVKLYRASTGWYEKSEHRFRIAWHWDGEAWALAQAVAPDVIYDKSAATPEALATKEALLKHFPMVNHPEFSTHAGNKLLVSQIFVQFAKPYHRVTSKEELTTVLAELPTGLVVAKPEHGNAGEGVLILESGALQNTTLSYPILVQEFIDSSAGIPGIMRGLHDLRLIFSNEEFLYAYYRMPKAGSFLANIARGGSLAIIEKESIPGSVWPIVKEVQAYYKKFKQKIYTLDLLFDQAGMPWIVELNTMPGLYPDESERPHINKLYLAIIRALKAAVIKK